MKGADMPGTFKERLYPVDRDPAFWGQFFGEVEFIYNSVSDFQRLQVFESKSWHGRVLVLDGVVQLTENGNRPYHEMLVHPAIFLHGHIKHALVIGGGDGGVIKELFRYPTIESVTMVDIDQAVINLCRELFPNISGTAFSDARLDLRINDGRVFVESCEERFDLIIVDSTDPIGPGAALFTEAFYRHCHRLLNPKGILVTQNGVPRLQGDELTDSMEFMSGLFSYTTCYLGDMPDYVGGNMAFGFASNANHFLAGWSTDETLVPAGLEYFNLKVLQGAFALPNYVNDLIGRA